MKEYIPVEMRHGSEFFLLDRYVALDLETTGLAPGFDSIIEVGMVRVLEGKIVETFQTLVMPDIKVPPHVKRLTGIEDYMLEGAPGLHQLREQIADFIEGECIIGHNVGFDVGFLESALGRRLHSPSYDTAELARIVMPTSKNYRLSELCRITGIKTEKSHRALEDAMAVMMLLEHLSGILGRLDGHTAMYLEAMLKKAGSPWGGVVVNNRGTAPARVRKMPGRTVDDSQFQAGERAAWGHVPPEEVRRLLSEEGPLPKAIQYYEHRPQQEEMAVEVARAFNDKKILLVEAGTGTGKSLSYLIPSLVWAAGGGPRVVIATGTINLQEQLWFKDIPQLSAGLGLSVRAVLAKGRSNYLCRRRWDRVLSEGLWAGHEARFYARVLVWTGETNRGDKSELNLNQREEEVWLNICADSDICMGGRCRHFPGTCFVAGARREADLSGIIITNHALLFSDIKTGNMVLPHYGPLIIDEAHHLEDAATEHLGRHVSRGDVGQWLSGASKLVAKNWDKVPPSDSDRWMKCLVALKEDTNHLRIYSEQFFVLLRNHFCRSGSIIEGDQQNFRLRDDSGLPRAEFENFIFGVKSVLSGLRKALDLVQSWDGENDSWGERANDFFQSAAKGDQILADLEFIYGCGDDSYVYWVTISGQGDWSSLTLNASPVRVGQMLYDKLFSEREAVVMTSATLTTDGSFDFFAGRVGLDHIYGDKVVKKYIESPFHYEKQSLLCVVSDLPLQGPESGHQYISAISGALEELIAAAGGKALVLFTSHRVLREVYGFLKAGLEDKDIVLLGHNIDGSRTRLVDEFMRTERAVLMGSASFWEGVDIPGEALTCVIIVKLPFPFPSAPVIEARMENLGSLGRSAFYEYYLPLAVIRFKQGFGRLIRTENDRGVVVVLDRRVIEKNYGKQFLSSLPVKSHFRGNIDKVAKKITQWMNL